MTNDINNFVTINFHKNGQLKLSQTPAQSDNIYEWIRDQGYRRAKIDNKNVYFKYEANSLLYADRSTAKLSFYRFFKESIINNNLLSEEQRYTILNWFYRKSRVVENKQYTFFLETTLNDDEIHAFKLQYDMDYRYDYNVTHLVLKLGEWGFSKTVSKCGQFHRDRNLHYKNIGENRYLIFSQHKIRNLKFTEHHDCSIATYEQESDIGYKKPLEYQQICMDFKIDKDYDLIKDYLT